jgi:hypothetical protein
MIVQPLFDTLSVGRGPVRSIDPKICASSEIIRSKNIVCRVLVKFFGASPFFFDLVLSVTLAATTRAVCSYFDA